MIVCIFERAQGRWALNSSTADGCAQGTRYASVNWIRRASAVFRPITSAAMCFVFAASLPPSVLIPCLFFYNVANSFIGAAQVG